MKKWIFFLIHTLGAILAVVLIVGNLFFRDHTDYLRIITSGIFIVVYFGSLKYYFPKKKLSDAFFEEIFKNEINGTFLDDKKTYKKLVKATRLYSLGDSQKSLELLKELENKCDTAKDFFAVYFFMGLCYREINPNMAIDAYQKALKYNEKHARTWSNIGVIYYLLKRYDLAYESYQHSLELGNKAPEVLVNMACVLVYMKKPEEVIEYAQKALSINSKLSDGYYAMAVAYKMLGNEEEAERYCKLLAVNGGNADYVRSVVADTPVLDCEEILEDRS